MRSVVNILSIILLCSICVASVAKTVHRWVDADGVTHFSDTAPSDNATAASTVVLDDDYADPADAQADYYSITNQWQRVREERDAKNKLSLERARLEADRQARNAVQAAPEIQPQAYGRYFPSYPTSYGRGLHDSGYGDHHGYPERYNDHATRSPVRGSRASDARAERAHRSRGGRARGGARHSGSGFGFGFHIR